MWKIIVEPVRPQVTI